MGVGMGWFFMSLGLLVSVGRASEMSQPGATNDPVVYIDSNNDGVSDWTIRNEVKTADYDVNNDGLVDFQYVWRSTVSTNLDWSWGQDLVAVGNNYFTLAAGFPWGSLEQPAGSPMRWSGQAAGKVTLNEAGVGGGRPWGGGVPSPCYIGFTYATDGGELLGWVEGGSTLSWPPVGSVMSFGSQWIPGGPVRIGDLAPFVGFRKTSEGLRVGLGGLDPRVTGGWILEVAPTPVGGPWTFLPMEPAKYAVIPWESPNRFVRARNTHASP